MDERQALTLTPEEPSPLAPAEPPLAPAEPPAPEPPPPALAPAEATPLAPAEVTPPDSLFAWDICASTATCTSQGKT